MSIISDIFTPSSLEETELADSEISMRSDTFDLLNNDVVTLKPSHDFERNKKEHSTLNEAAEKAVVFDVKFLIHNQDNDLKNYTDSEFNEQVSFANK